MVSEGGSTKARRSKRRGGRPRTRRSPPPSPPKRRRRPRTAGARPRTSNADAVRHATDAIYKSPLHESSRRGRRRADRGAPAPAPAKRRSPERRPAPMPPAPHERRHAQAAEAPAAAGARHFGALSGGSRRRSSLLIMSVSAVSCFGPLWSFSQPFWVFCVYRGPALSRSSSPSRTFRLKVAATHQGARCACGWVFAGLSIASLTPKPMWQRAPTLRPREQP